MIEAAFKEDLSLLANALRQDAFRFILIGHNRRSVYLDIAQWLRTHLPGRAFAEMEFAGKDYRRIVDELSAIENSVVLIPDFDWLFLPENESICVAFNQRRDYFARRPIALVCFLQPANLLLAPRKLPDWWSLRSLDLEFHREMPEEEPFAFETISLSGIEPSSLGGETRKEKATEINRLLRQIKNADPDNASLLILLHSQLGELYFALAEYDKALASFETCLGLSRQIGDQKEEGGALNNIGQVCYAKGQHDEALRYWEQSLSVKRKINDLKGEGIVLNKIGQVYLDKSDYDSALKFFEKSLAVWRQIGDRHGEGSTLNDIGRVYSAKGEYDAALQLWKQGLAILQQIGNRRMEGATLNNISHVHKIKGDYNTAVKYLEQSLAVQRQIDDTPGMALTMHNLGGVYFDQNQFEEAIPYFHQSNSILKEIGSPFEEKTARYLKSISKKIGKKRFREIIESQKKNEKNQ